MRKLLFAALFATASFSATYAQKVEKLDDVQEKFSKGKYDEAKEKIDKVLADPKNQNLAAAWYWKGNVYSQLAKADSMNQLSYDAANEAFNAYKKYQELDPKNVLMTLEQNVGLFMLRDVYATKGDQFWSKKQFSKAYQNYKNALEVEEYVSKKGFTYNNYAYPAMDTTLIRYTAAAAYSDTATRHLAIPYFERLADARIKEKDYKDIYAMLVQYHQGQGNETKAGKYLAMGKEFFPDPEYWLGIELGDLGNDKEKRMARLEEMAKKYPENGTLALDYAIELRNNAYIYDTKPTDYKARQDKYFAALQKALAMNQKSILTNYLLSEHYYIQIVDIEDELRLVRGNTPADQAKKKEINARLDKKYEELLGAALKAYEMYAAEPTLKVQDKANFRKVINQLIDYYQRKKNTERVTFYQNKLKTL